MSYEIIEYTEFVQVRLFGDVHAIDLLLSHEEEIFLDALENTNVAIYDYRDAANILITENDASRLAELANKIAKYQNPLHIIIIPKDANRPELAQRYKATVRTQGVQVDIAGNLDQAKSFVLSNKKGIK